MVEPRIVEGKNGQKYSVIDVMKVEVTEQFKRNFLRYDYKAGTLSYSTLVKKTEAEKLANATIRKEKSDKLKAERKAEKSVNVVKGKAMRTSITEAKKVARKTLNPADVEKLNKLEADYQIFQAPKE